MKRLLAVVVVVASAVAGLAVAGNAESEQDQRAPAADSADRGSPQPAEADVPVPGSESPQADYLESFKIQTGGLPAPAGLACGADSASISLSWEAVDGADEYRVLLGGVPWAVAASTAHRLDGLPSRTRFDVGVQAGGSDGWGAPASQVCATQSTGAVADAVQSASAADLLPWPKNFRCTDSTTSSITMKWDAVASASGYRVVASLPVNARSGTLAGSKSVTATTAEIGGLMPFTSYVMSVRSVKDGKEGIGYGRPCSTKAAAPECPEFSKPHSIELDWAENVRPSSISIYQWYVARVDGSSYTDGRAVSGATTSTVFTGLEPKTLYTFRFWWRATQNGSWFEVLPRSSCITGDDPPPPPTGLVCAATTATTITLVWKPSQGATKYEAGFSPSDAPWNETANKYFRFTGLSPDTRYTLHVRAGNTKGWSSVANKACRTTPRPLPEVTGLACTATATEITASWDDPDAALGVDDYQVSKDAGAVWENPDGAETTHAFGGLTPDTAYAISVRAHNAAGWGPKADKSCRTGNPDPSPAVCGAATAASVTLEWAPEEGVFMWLAARATTGDMYADGRKLDASAASTVFTGLTPGLSYTFRFWWRVAEGAEWVEVLPSAVCSTVRLPAPEDVACEASDTAVVLLWDEVSGATAYQVSMTDYPWFTPDSSSSHKFAGLTADTSYGLRVRAGAADGGRTGWGEEASVECSTLAAPLGAPSGLACATSLTGAALSWDEVSGATKYRVSTDGGTTWAAADGPSSHTVAGLVPAAAHNVQVQAGNAAAWGGTASAACPAVVVPAPAELMCATTLSSITLTWKAIDGVQGYTATLKSSSSPDAKALQTVTTTGTSAKFKGLTAGGTYYVAAQANHPGLAAGAAGIWCFANAAPPTCAAVGADFVVVSWPADDMVHQWRAAMAVGTQSFSKIAVLPSDELTARFGGLSPETDYTFHLWWRSSAHSPWLQIYPPATCTTTERPPAAPAGFVCAAQTSSTITARWSPVDGADGYRVSSDNETTWTEPDGTATSHTFSGLTPSTQYQLAVQARNAGGWGPSAKTACSTSEPPLPAPIGAVCTAAINSVHLRWNPVGGATRYRVSKDSGKTWNETTGTTHTLTGLAADTPYDSIRMQTGDADGWDGTKAISCRTLPATALAAPGGLNCAASADSVTLSWSPVTGATRYRAGHGHTWTAASAAARSHTFDSLTPNTSYDLRVQAGDADGWQSVAAAKPCSTAAAPLPAPVLRCTSASPTSVTWGWDPVAGATGYQHRTSSIGTWQTTTTPGQIIPTTAFTAAATPGTRYQLRVRATGAGDPGPETAHHCHSAPNSGPAHPEMPLPACAKATTTSITVQWPPAHAATGYKVGHKDNSYQMQHHTKAELSVTVTGLNPNQSSFVLLQAANATGSTTEVISCRTLAEAPQNLTITCTANNDGPPTITIAWDATSGADTYQMTLTRQETPQGGTPQTAVIATYTGKQTVAIADGEHDSGYQAMARARTTAGWSDWASTATGQCPTST